MHPTPPIDDIADEAEIKRMLDDAFARTGVQRLFDLTAPLTKLWADGPSVARVLDRDMERAVAAAVPFGWGRDDLKRVVTKVVGVDAGRLVARAGAIESLWKLGAKPERLPVLDALRALLWVRTLPTMHPVNADVEADGIDSKILHRVRSLLAKAESTTFEAEAMALTTKAQDLMVRHMIDAVLLNRSGKPDGGVLTRRIFVDDPHARARFHLLASVADANGCRALFAPNLGFVVVYGYRADLESTELLYTSLIVQATVAMEASRPPRAVPAHVAAYRRAFLVAFGERVGERLKQARIDTVRSASESSGDLLPILASRVEAVEAAVQAANPRVRQAKLKVGDAEGWIAGDEAGKRASLTNQPRLSGRNELEASG